MASGGPPDRMAPKHRLAAMLAAAGRSHNEIAETLGFHPNRISILAGSPLFQALVREFQSDLLARVADVTTRLHAEAGPTLAKLVELRDGAKREETQLSAANSLADRIPALSKKAVDAERTLRVLLSADVEPLIEAIALSKGLPPPKAVPRRAAAPVNGHRQVNAPPIDEVLANWPEPEPEGRP